MTQPQSPQPQSTEQPSTNQPSTAPLPAGRRLGDGVLRTSWFECVTSFLTALIVLIGTVVVMLGIIWWLSGPASSDSPPTRSPKIARGTEIPQGVDNEFVEPGAEETVDLSQPSLQDDLLAVTDAVSRVAGSLSTANVSQQGQPGQNHGADRLPGPDDLGGMLPRFERWQLEFQAKDLASYAGQLDHYGIELGLIGGSIQGVDYAGQLVTGPQHRRGDAESERRLYFMWHRPSPLMNYDRQLLARTGVATEGRHILKFIPSELENQLAKIELEYARSHGRHSVEAIAKTVFTSRADGKRYIFVVSDQRYRKQTN